MMPERLQKIEQTDALLAEYTGNVPGCAISVIHEHELIFDKGYGVSNLDHNIPNDSDSVFYIASTSKQFTAAT